MHTFQVIVHNHKKQRNTTNCINSLAESTHHHNTSAGISY